MPTRGSQGSQHHEKVELYHSAKVELQVLLTLAEVYGVDGGCLVRHYSLEQPMQADGRAAQASGQGPNAGFDTRGTACCGPVTAIVEHQQLCVCSLAKLGR